MYDSVATYKLRRLAAHWARCARARTPEITGSESVTFHAMAGHTYFVVVDGKAGAMANYHVEIAACGACQPTPSTTLACNSSMPLSGDTSHGKPALPNGLKYVALSHNTRMGAAKGAMLIAEYLVHAGYIAASR